MSKKTYRVFIKYWVFWKILNIPDSCRSLFSLGVNVCTHIRQVEHQRCSRTGRVKKNDTILRKKHNILLTPCTYFITSSSLWNTYFKTLVNLFFLILSATIGSSWSSKHLLFDCSVYLNTFPFLLNVLTGIFMPFRKGPENSILKMLSSNSETNVEDFQAYFFLFLFCFELNLKYNQFY